MPYTDPQAKRNYQREWKQGRRDAWFKGKVCRSCGSTDRLEANHIDPSTKLYEPGSIWGMSDTNPDKIAELAKLEPLCHDCHVDLSRKEPTHGTPGGYDHHKCRCDLCRAWNAARRRKQRAALKERRG